MSLIGEKALSEDTALSYPLSFCPHLLVDGDKLSLNLPLDHMIILTHYGKIRNLESPVLERTISVSLAVVRNALAKTSALVFMSNWQTISSSLLLQSSCELIQDHVCYFLTRTTAFQVLLFYVKAVLSASTVLELSLCFYIATRYVHQPEG